MKEALIDANASTVGYEGKKKVYIRTFGYFDFFVNGKPLCFSNMKEKELLAILVDRNGGTLNAGEAISILWEDEPADKKQVRRFRQLERRLRETMADAGCADLLITAGGVTHLDIIRTVCDFVEAVNGNEWYRRQYQGKYMMNYPWAQDTEEALNVIIS